MSAVKVSTLISPALDWAVEFIIGGCKAEPHANYWLERWIDPKRRYLCESASTDWSQGGPVVEREIDQISRYETYPDYRADRFATDDYEDCHAIGPTMLIAAMRCYVASKLGDEVDIPEELL